MEKDWLLERNALEIAKPFKRESSFEHRSRFTDRNQIVKFVHLQS